MYNGQVPCHPSQRVTVEKDSQTHTQYAEAIRQTQATNIVDWHCQRLSVRQLKMQI